MRNAGKVVIVLWVLLLASGSLAFAENGFLDLASPVLLGGGGGTATLETPFGTLLNPSVSADRQRVTLDLSYIALTQLTPAFALGGDVVNLGVSLPNRAVSSRQSEDSPHLISIPPSLAFSGVRSEA